jgi:hypothetical protein
MKQNYIILIFLAMALFIMPSLAHAQAAPTATLTASPKRITLNQSTTLTLTISTTNSSLVSTIGSLYSVSTIPQIIDCNSFEGTLIGPNTTSCTITPTRSGWNVYDTIIEYGNQQNQTVAVLVQVSPEPPTVLLLQSATTADSGQPVTFTASSSGGTAPYTYSWTGCISTTSTCTIAPIVTSTQIEPVSVTITDITQTQSAPAKATATYGPIPTVSLSPSTSAANSGQPVTFTASPSGGTAQYTYSWTLPSGVSPSASDCISTTSTCTIAPTVTSAQTEAVSVTITDSAQEVTSMATSSAAYSPVVASPPVSSGGGGSSLPSITLYKNGSESGWQITNLSFDNSETLNLNSNTETVHLTVNFITPTSVGITLNNQTFNLSVGKPVILASQGNYTEFAALKNISYVSSLHTITLLVYGQHNQPVSIPVAVVKPVNSTTSKNATAQTKPTNTTTLTTTPITTVPTTTTVQTIATAAPITTSRKWSQVDSTMVIFGGVVILVAIAIAAFSAFKFAQ